MKNGWMQKQKRSEKMGKEGEGSCVGCVYWDREWEKCLKDGCREVKPEVECGEKVERDKS